MPSGGGKSPAARHRRVPLLQVRPRPPLRLRHAAAGPHRHLGQVRGGPRGAGPGNPRRRHRVHRHPRGAQWSPAGLRGLRGGPDHLHPAGRQEPPRAHLRVARAIRGLRDAGVQGARGRARGPQGGSARPPRGGGLRAEAGDRGPGRGRHPHLRGLRPHGDAAGGSREHAGGEPAAYPDLQTDAGDHGGPLGGMASDALESPPNLAGRLRRVGEMLIGLSGSPVPTHLFQTLAEQAETVVPHDYLAVCLEDAERRGYLAHSLSGLVGEPVGTRVFTRDEGLPGRTIRTGRAHLVGDLERIADGAPDLDGVLVRAGLRAALAVPLRRGMQVLGALLFVRRSAPYTLDDLEVATLLAAGVSGALETCRAYQALADERGTLAAVLTSTADAVVMVGQDGLVLLANPAARAMLGVAPEAMTGRPFFEAVEHEPLRRLFEIGQPGVAELPLPDGRIAQASLVFVTTEYGEPVGLAAVLRDITLLKNLEQMKNDFVNTVSHDLKGPITVIAGMADLMRMAGPGDENHESRCQDIRDAAQHMADLVTDLLDLGKIEAGLDAAREPMDLIPVIGEALRLVKPRADTKSIELHAELPEETIVSAVPSRLRQVLINLIDNGVKYTPSGGRVTIAVAVSSDGDGNGTVTIRVTDTGIGIPARDLPHVFDKFYRAKSQATKEIAGTGLGLAITRSIVEAYGGRISAESLEGTGTTFV